MIGERREGEGWVKDMSRRQVQQSTDLFAATPVKAKLGRVGGGEQVEKLTRLDIDDELRRRILPYCRLAQGEIWTDPLCGHRVGAIDARDPGAVRRLVNGDPVQLALNDPPYNVRLAGKSTDALFELTQHDYDEFSARWIANCVASLGENASFYCWLGANYKNGFHPVPEVITLLRSFKELTPRNWITVRNQRGFGTQKNWMWVRQELLYYTKGTAHFDVNAEYTDIPKILRGYYKKVGGELTENLERSNSENIRAGNVWVDIQQVFYRLEENVPGCYAQKPLKAIDRIIQASSQEGDTILDLFSHSGTTLVAGERLGRRVITCDLDPIYVEISLRRLERMRRHGKMGWQWEHPFPEIEPVNGPV
jgi:site-specific DNA-methyltransferase (adenine-specific)